MKQIKNQVRNKIKIRKKLVAFVVLFVLLCSSCFYVAIRVKATNGVVTADEKDNSNNGDNTGETDITKQDSKSGVYSVNKDETVYVNLNYDGSISKINVVNYFRALESGIYQDYGNYDNITNLTNEIEPNLEGDSIQWNLSGTNLDFYYQGQLTDGELPWVFDFVYKLDGEVVEASELLGSVGELIITINVRENIKADEYFRQNYMMQITVPLNMQNATLVSAIGGVQMIAGHTKTIAFTVLPQTNASFEIKTLVNDFTMESMDIAMMKADLSAYMQTEEMTKGFGEMSNGMEELAEGTLQLKDGMKELSGGIDKLSEGIDELALGTPKLLKGMDQFGYGIKTFEANLKDLSTGSNLMAVGLQGITQNGKQLLSGYQEIEEGMSSLLSMKQELSAMAGEMAKSTDPQTVMLAHTILGQIEGMSGLQEGINTLNTNLNQYMQGVEEASGKYTAFNSGIKELPGGLNQLYKGYQEIKNGNEAVYQAVDGLSKGLSDINSATAAIPDQVQQLADGQKDMKTGIDQAIEEIEAFTGTGTGQNEKTSVSYAAPGKVAPNSVQFVLRTPAIEKLRNPKENVEIEAEAKNFWEKLLDLFR